MGSIVQATPPGSFTIPKTEFKKEYFDSAVWDKGYDVIVEKAFKCPCMTADNHPLTDCQNCLGLGWTFINPLQSRALIHSVNFSTQTKNWSELLIGTISVTLRDIERVGFMDKITIMNSPLINNKSTYSEVLTIRLDTATFVFLAYKPINIIGVWAFNGSNVPLVKLPESSYSVSLINPYVVNITYDFSTLPNFNNTISILYLHSMTYNILDLPHDIRNSYKVNNNGKEEQIILPINGIARKTQNIMDIAKRDGTGIQDNSFDKNIWNGL